MRYARILVLMHCLRTVYAVPEMRQGRMLTALARPPCTGRCKAARPGEELDDYLASWPIHAIRCRCRRCV